MKKYHLLTWSSLCGMALMAVCAVTAVSCAEDGYDDGERFESGTKNATLVSPAADDITISASADGKNQTITWPVVQGAGGYLFSFYDASNLEEPIVKDSLVDGCSVTVKREEDMNYRIDLRTMGNAKNGNVEAQETTQKLFSTFTPTFRTIPAGSDLKAWFEENPIPEEQAGEMLNFDLESGANYTLSGALDFDGQAVTLRSTSKTNPATITYTDASSCINFAAAFNAKYLHFDCSGMANNIGAFGFSPAPTAERDETYGFVIIKDPVTFVNCTFNNMNGYFFWDNRKGQKVAAVTFLVDNCVVELTPPAFIKAAVIWTNNGGHINDLTISNSTFYNLSDGDIYYFYQAGGYRAKDIGLGGSGTDQGGPGNSVSYKNSTFYRIGYYNNEGEWGNYNGMNAKADSFWTMTDCIFYACSAKGGVPRRFLHGRTYSSGSGNVNFANNTYMQADGSFDPVGSYDTSGTQIEEDPLFANPAAGDFHISGATQVARKTGDPRWLP